MGFPALESDFFGIISNLNHDKARKKKCNKQHEPIMCPRDSKKQAHRKPERPKKLKEPKIFEFAKKKCHKFSCF